MSDLLQGTNEAYTRLRAMEHQTNTGSIMYPSGTNDRGYTNRSREHHAHGERVGGESSAPGRGGSHMKPHFGKPHGGVEDGAARRIAVKQARAENHKRGERVGEDRERYDREEHHDRHPSEHRKKEHHAMGDMVGGPRAGAMMGPRHMGARAQRPMPDADPQPMGAYRSGGKTHKKER